MVNVKTFSKSFKYASEGLWYAFMHDQNLRIHIFIAIVVMIMSLIFHLSGFEMGIIGVIILLVICTEMINTAIEKMVDLITTEHRKEAKIAKDVAAGMVLLTAFGSIIIGILIFVPHIFRFFQKS